MKKKKKKKKFRDIMEDIEKNGLKNITINEIIIINKKRKKS